MKKLKIIPNIITLIRLILIPVITYLILINKTTLALIFFLIAVLSDRLDGYLARKLKQETYYGGVFDALTDGLMIFFVLITFYITKYFSLVFLLILIAPKIITFLLSIILNKKKYRPTTYSRLTSLLLYIILPFFLLGVNEIIIIALAVLFYILSIIHWVMLIKSR